MAFAQLGNLRWRIDPQAIAWNYQVDVARTETLGGQVVQVLGATLSDITVTGQFGQDHASRRESWQLANAFHRRIQSMVDAQTLPAKTIHLGDNNSKSKNKFSDSAAAHVPIRFSYLDGEHNWNFGVLIKSLADPDGNSLLHRTGKFSYNYALTLFIVEANTQLIRNIAADIFISRISAGLGWKQTTYNGAMTARDAQLYIQENGGTVTAFLEGLMIGGSS
jgi:hypothetical protein